MFCLLALRCAADAVFPLAAVAACDPELQGEPAEIVFFVQSVQGFPSSEWVVFFDPSLPSFPAVEL